MRAIAIDSFGGREVLARRDLPIPSPGRGEVLIHVVASGVNPVDWKIREGLLAAMIPHAFPLIPGWEAAGVVEDLGEGTGRLRRGDRVWTYARKPVVQGGTYAEFVVVTEASVAKVPTGILFEEAAGVPLAALTAWQVLFDKARIAEGAIVLVHAAAGGVGHFAVQLARHAGARVLGTAGPTNQEFVLSLGAEAVIDYTREDFRDGVRRRYAEGVDVVLDAIGGDVQRRSFDVLKPGGILVSIVGPPDAEAASARGVRCDEVFVAPSAEQLDRLAALVQKKKLRPRIQKILPLAEAGAAHALSEAGHVRGKLVLAL